MNYVPHPLPHSELTVCAVVVLLNLRACMQFKCMLPSRVIPSRVIPILLFIYCHNLQQT